jgi:hypothetical protein
MANIFPEMILYKYKPPTPFEHIADILLNERLYCGPYWGMNDPFEGEFLESIEMNGRHFSTLTTPDDLIDPEDALQAHVCSLSSDSSNVLLWSLYAQRLEGVCLEVDCAGLQPAPHEVTYTRDIPQFAQPGFAPSVVYALAHKSDEWRFEQEHRLIRVNEGSSEFVPIQGCLRRVMLGPRCNKTIGLVIRKLAPCGCDVCETKLDRDHRAIVIARKLKAS